MRAVLADTPIGCLELEACAQGLTRIRFLETPTEPIDARGELPHLEQAALQLGEYFEGRRRDFDLPLAPEGTAFQRLVWAQLLRVPAGFTRSYGDIARRLGKPTAARAVGLANHRNPLPIVVPCHRVVGANGSLTGYSGGLDKKRALLDLEQPQLSLFG